MNFDDGSNPWKNSDYTVQILDVGGAGNLYSKISIVTLMLISLTSLYNLI